MRNQLACFGSDALEIISRIQQGAIEFLLDDAADFIARPPTGGPIGSARCVLALLQKAIVHLGATIMGKRSRHQVVYVGLDFCAVLFLQR